jgi:hypothetical protein
MAKHRTSESIHSPLEEDTGWFYLLVSPPDSMDVGQALDVEIQSPVQ